MAEIDPTKTATLREDFRRALQKLPARAKKRALDILNSVEIITEDVIEQILAVIEEEINREKALQIIDLFLPLAYQRGANFALRKLKRYGISIDITATVADPETISALRGLTLEYIRGMKADLKKKLREILVRSQLENWPRKELVNKISNEFNLSKTRAEMIARTEIIRAFNEGAWQRYKAAGFKRWKWLTAADERVCAICGPKDGRVYPEGAQRPPAHPRCRCTILPATEKPTISIEKGGDEEVKQFLARDGFRLIKSDPLDKQIVERAISKIDHVFDKRVSIVLEPYRAVKGKAESLGFVIPISFDPLKLEKKIHLTAGVQKYYARKKMWLNLIKEHFPEKESLIKRIEGMTKEDLIASTILHEYGHIKTTEKIVNAKDLSFLKDYYTRKEVRAALRGRPGSLQWRLSLAEVIAEDYRIMKGSPLPNQEINRRYPYDLENPKLFRERKKILEEVFGL